MHWQPFVFIGVIIAAIAAYEYIAPDDYTITVAMREMSNRARWFAVLVLILTGFFVCHCFAGALGITQ